MQISIPTKFSQVEGITKVKKALHAGRAQLASQVSDVKEEWKENILNFEFVAQKYKISGTLAIKDKLFDLNVKLPLTLRLFEGRIKKMIEEQTKMMFG